MRFNKTLVTIAVTASFTCQLSYAQQNQQQKTQSLQSSIEKIVVIGRRDDSLLNLASHIKTIDSSEIINSNATNLTQVLRNQAGIQVSDSNSGAVFSMRGFGSGQAANNTLILIDGRRINNIDIAAPAINAIGLSQVERIEILSASAGVLYGDQAVGGVINIITQSTLNSGGDISIASGNFNHKKASVNYSNTVNEHWRYSVSANTNNSDNYRKHNANKTRSIIAKLEKNIDGLNWYLESSYFDNERQLAGSLTKKQFEHDPRQVNPSNIKDHFHDKTKALGSGLTYQFNKVWRLNSEFSYKKSDVNGIGRGQKNRNQRTLLSFSPKIVGSFITKDGELSLLLGSDVNKGKSQFLNGRSNTQTLLSTYTQASVPLTKGINYVVGGRYAKVKDDLIDTEVYPNGTHLDESATAFELGLNYRPTQQQRLYLRAESNFRFAKVDEQAYTSPNVHGLKPQTGRSFEFGWNRNSQTQNLGINLYRLALKDEIVFDATADKPYPKAPFNGANINAQASTRYGADIDWKWQVNPWLNLQSNYHYIDATFSTGKNKGKALPWIAKHSGQLQAQIDLNKQWRLFLQANYMGDRFTNGDNTNSAPKLAGYWLSNLAINYQTDRWRTSFKVNNMLNEKYASAAFGNSYYVGDGRNWLLSINYKI
ncbi:MAG: TonB-dependent receptor [Parashewanella sp.]